MASFNKVILIGHLTADPELKQTTSGLPVTSFSIGVNRRFTKQGEQPQTDFINIVKGQADPHLRLAPDPFLGRQGRQ